MAVFLVKVIFKDNFFQASFSVLISSLTIFIMACFPF
jgi:hypothetical protein